MALLSRVSHLDVPQLPRRIWGRTGISVPVISFGTQGFGDNFGTVSYEDSVALINRAIDLGVNHFDCALCYGDSMMKLAIALRDIPRQQVIISGRICAHARRSKIQSALDNRSTINDVVKDVETQLQLLGIDYFDALLIHDPVDIELTLSSGGLFAGLDICKKRGLVRWIGYGMMPESFHLRVLETLDVDTMLHFNDYHLIRQNAAYSGGILEKASNRSVGVMNGWSILRGLLTDANLDEAVKRGGLDDPNDLRLAASLRCWAKTHEVSLLAIALQFCLRESRIHSLPIGMRNLCELEQCITAVTSALPNNIWCELHEWRTNFIS